MLYVPALFKARGCIVSAAIRLIIQRRARIIIVQFLRVIVHYHRPSCYGSAIGSVIPSNVQFFSASLSRTRGLHRSIPTYFTALELANYKTHVTYTLVKRCVHFTCQCKTCIFSCHQLNKRWR